MLRGLRKHVSMYRFCVFTNITACSWLFVPLKFPVMEVSCFCFSVKWKSCKKRTTSLWTINFTLPFLTESIQVHAPSLQDAPGYREFERAWFLSKARTWCNLSTTRHMAVTNPTPGWLQEPDSDVSTRSYYDVRGQKLRCQSRWAEYRCTLLCELLDSKTNKGIVISSLTWRSMSNSPFVHWNLLQNQSSQRVCFRASNPYALACCRAEI